VRTCDNPDRDGIDLRHALQCKLENVVINTGVYNVQSSKPTHDTKGLITPACNNAALTILRNVAVTGYHTGIVPDANELPLVAGLSDDRNKAGLLVSNFRWNQSRHSLLLKNLPWTGKTRMESLQTDATHDLQPTDKVPYNVTMRGLTPSDPSGRQSPLPGRSPDSVGR